MDSHGSNSSLQTLNFVDQREDIPLYNSSTSVSYFSSFRKRLRAIRDVGVSFVACIGAVSMGLALGYSSPALQDPTVSDILGTDDNKSWFGSLLPLGAMIGGVAAAPCIDKLGRKRTLMLCNLPFAVGWLMVAFAHVGSVLFIGRIFTGIGMGSICLSAPVYVAEVAASSRRGILGANFQLLVTFGVLLSYVIGSMTNWAWLAAVGAVVTTVHFLLLLTVVETPRWLLRRQQREEANQTLAWLRGYSDITSEFSEMEQCNDASLSEGQSSFTFQDLLRANVYKPLLISVGLVIFQQMNGTNAVIFYATAIFYKAGYKTSASTNTILIGIVFMVSTLLSCILVDLAGRRLLLLLSGCLMCVGITVIGIDFYLNEQQQNYSQPWLPLFCLVLYIAGFSLGWGPVPYLVMSEVFQPKSKGFSGGVSIVASWLSAFVVTKSFHGLESVIQDYGAFWTFGCICALSVAFVAIFVPETKGKSLEQIESNFTGNFEG